VTTKDGYILNVFRVMNDEVLNGKKKPVVFMQHGLLSLADTWIMNKPEVAPAFMLARAGWDVWLGNNRGNMYSRKHVSLDPDTDKAEYFDYSFDDLGEYDLPAQVSMVKQQTGVDKVTYMGHSQGTSQMFYASTTNQDWITANVNLFVACAPVTRMNGASTSMKVTSSSLSMVEGALYSMSIYEIFDTGTRDKYNAFMSSFTGKTLSSMSSLISKAVNS